MTCRHLLCVRVGTPGLESSYLKISVDFSLDFGSAELPALMVALEYLDACEGVIWKRVRGLGVCVCVRVFCLCVFECLCVCVCAGVLFVCA